MPKFLEGFDEEALKKAIAELPDEFGVTAENFLFNLAGSTSSLSGVSKILRCAGLVTQGFTSAQETTEMYNRRPYI